MPVDSHEIEKFARDLDKMAKRAIPHAMRNSLNRSAFAGRKIWKKEIKSTFVTRNTWTERSIRVDKARGTNLTRMESVLGSVADYMGKQERGGRVSGRGKTKSIPTSFAAGQMGAIPRTRLVRGAHKVGRIRLGRKPRGGTRRQRNAIGIKQAAAQGRKFVFLELPTSRGLFKLTGGKRKPSIKMVWSLSQSSVQLKPEPTLKRTLKRMDRVIPKIHMGAIKEQIKRNGLFKK